MTGAPNDDPIRPARGCHGGSAYLTGTGFGRNTGPGAGLRTGAPGLDEHRPRRTGCCAALARTAWTACRNAGPWDGFRTGPPLAPVPWPNPEPLTGPAIFPVPGASSALASPARTEPTGVILARIACRAG